MFELFREFREWRALRRKETLLRAFAVGMNSTVDFTEDKHLVCLDYDIDDLERVSRSVEEVQEFWGLSDAQIFRTKHGHHCFFWWDIVPYDRLKLIIDFARDVDPMYKYIGRYYDHRTIRVAGKYKERDIFFVRSIPGCREPTREERDLGELKREEHAALLKMSVRMEDEKSF